MDPIRLVIVDSEEAFREGVAQLLKQQAKMNIVFQSSSCQEAVEKCDKTKPDIVLMDSHITDGDALQTVREFKDRSPEIKVVMLSRIDSNKNPLDFMKAGARAVLAKNISANDLIKSLELVSSGRLVISPLFAEKFLQEISVKQNQDMVKEIDSEPILSEREIEIAKLVSEGATNKEIAEKLFIAENTAKVHVKNILNKLELKNRQQLAVYTVMKEWMKSSPEREKKDSDTPI